MAIIKRTVKGSALTHAELDGNFDHLENSKHPLIPYTPANDAEVIKVETDPTVPAHVKGITTTDITEWNDAFDKKTVSISVTGDETKTLTLTREDGSILTATFPDQSGIAADDVINTLEFNLNNDGVLQAKTAEGASVSVTLDGRYSLLGHTHTQYIEEETDPTVPTHVKSILVQDITNWTTAFNKRLVGAVVTGDENKILTLTFGDSTILTASFTDIAGVADGDEYVNSLNFNTETGILAVGRTGTLTDITVSMDGRYLTSLPAHTHTRAEITDFAHTHAWGDITGVPNFIETELDPTVPQHVKEITTTDISNWNGANAGASASIPIWSATSYTLGSTVSYKGTIWRASEDIVSTEIPGENKKWIAVTDIVSGGVIHLNFEPVDIIYTWKNYILEYVDGVSEDIRFSKDSGKTWTTWTNPYGPIARTHIFTNGTVMFCTASRVFNTKDFVTVSESTVLDFDGSPFVPKATHFFSIMPQLNPIVKIDGVEMVAWGDYMITGATGQTDYISRYWYSTDYGATLKCAIKEGVTVIGGQVYDVRHIHGYGYDTHRNKFVLTSGDNNYDSRVVEGTYTPSTDKWEFKLMQKGILMKFGQVLFDEHYTYFLTDYTEPGRLRGIKRCPSDRLDVGPYEYIYMSDNEIAPLICYYEDTNGNRILTGDGEMRGEIYYAKNDFNFKIVTHNQDVPMGMYTLPNYQGDQYIQLFSNSYQTYGVVRRKYVNLTKAFRDAGVYDFNQEQVILGRNENTSYQDAKAGSLIGTTIKLHPEGNNYNYSSPSNATSYSVSLSPAPKVNDFARCFINAPSEPVVNIPSGTVERVSLQITDVPTTAGNVTITLDGVAYDIAIDPTVETTTKLVAAKIKNTVFTGWTTALGGYYDAEGGHSNVTFTSTTEGDKVDATYNAGATGANGKLYTVDQGTSDTVATKITGIDFVADTNMEMVIECPVLGTYEYYFLKR